MVFLPLLLGLAATALAQQRARHLIISEVIEGSSNNKAIEIYNPTADWIELSKIYIGTTSNGNCRENPASVDINGPCDGEDGAFPLPKNYLQLSKVAEEIAPGATLVVCHINALESKEKGGLLSHAQCDLAGNGSPTYHNGNDAIVLFELDRDLSPLVRYIDVVGDIITQDPLTPHWAVCGVSKATIDKTLVRKPTVVQGNVDWAASAGTNTDDCEWIVMDKDTVTELKKHECVEPVDAAPWAPEPSLKQITDTPDLFISEVIEGLDSNRHGTSYNRAIEIYNPTDAPVDLRSYWLGHNDDGLCRGGSSDLGDSKVKGRCSSDGPRQFPTSFKYLSQLLPKNSVGFLLQPGETLTICSPASISIANKGGTIEASRCGFLGGPVQFSGEDGIILAKGTFQDFEIIDEIGDMHSDLPPLIGWTACGTAGATADHTMIRKPWVVKGNGGDWVVSRGTQATDCEWIIQDADTSGDLNQHSCLLPQVGTTAPSTTPTTTTLTTSLTTTPTTTTGTTTPTTTPITTPTTSTPTITLGEWKARHRALWLEFESTQRWSSLSDENKEALALQAPRAMELEASLDVPDTVSLVLDGGLLSTHGNGHRRSRLRRAGAVTQSAILVFEASVTKSQIKSVVATLNHIFASNHSVRVELPDGSVHILVAVRQTSFVMDVTSSPTTTETTTETTSSPTTTPRTTVTTSTITTTAKFLSTAAPEPTTERVHDAGPTVQSSADECSQLLRFLSSCDEGVMGIPVLVVLIVGGLLLLGALACVVKKCGSDSSSSKSSTVGSKALMLKGAVAVWKSGVQAHGDKGTETRNPLFVDGRNTPITVRDSRTDLDGAFYFDPEDETDGGYIGLE